MSSGNHNEDHRADGHEESLIEQAVAGDEVSLTLLLTESREQLCRLIAGKTSRDLQRVVTADDIVQEAHTEVFRRITSFEPRGGDSFHRWVATIAVRRLRSAIREHRAAKRGGGRRAKTGAGNPEESTIALLDLLGADGGTPSRSVARREAVAALQTALADLPEQYRRAIWLVHIEGLPVKEVAVEMGRTERAIHGLCRRGIARMRERLGSGSKFLTSFG